MRLRLKPKDMNKEKMSRLYKTTFSDGTVFFSRVRLSKGYSAKTFCSDVVSHYHANMRNPLRHSMVTEFERMMVKEIESVKCEIIFEGPTNEAMEMRDKLIQSTPNCGNVKKSVENNKGTVEVIRVGKEFSKVLKSVNGEMVNYVSVEWARLRGLWEKCDFNQRHPMDRNFIRIFHSIERF
jgi:hypothetical protein